MSKKADLTERHMVRLSPEDLKRYRAAAARLSKRTGVPVTLGAWMRLACNLTIELEERAS